MSNVYKLFLKEHRDLCEEAAKIVQQICSIWDLPAPLESGFVNFLFWAGAVQVTWKRYDRYDSTMTLEFPADYMFKKDWRDVELKRKLSSYFKHLKVKSTSKEEILPIPVKKPVKHRKPVFHVGKKNHYGKAHYQVN